MRPIARTLLWLSLFLAAPLAAEPPSHARAGEERITVAIPDGGGLISLGVFSGDGKLVRALKQLAPETEFIINTNGLMVTWDQTDAMGKPVPSGTYSIEGWFIPQSVQAAGIAVHFNDWIDDEGNLPLSRVLGAVPKEGDDFLLMACEASTGKPAAWHANEEELTNQLRPFDGAGTLLFANQSWAIFTSPKGGGALAYSLLDPSSPAVVLLKGQNLVTATLQGTKLFAASAQGLVFHEPDILSPAEGLVPMEAPPGIALLAAGQNKVFLSDGVRLWVRNAQGFQEIPTGDPLAVLALSAGPADTVWLAGKLSGEGSHSFVRQYEVDGTLLRELNLEDALPLGIFTPEDTLGVFVLTQETPSQQVRLRGLRPVNSPRIIEGVSDWEVFIDRSLTSNPGVAAATGEGLPGFSSETTSEKASAETVLRIAPSSLDPQPRKETLRAVIGSDGAWLEDSHGLRLATLCDQPDIQTIQIVRGEHPGSIRALVVVPGGALEYVIPDLNQIVRLQAGDVILEP